jgi:hypothetical protein
MQKSNENDRYMSEAGQSDKVLGTLTVLNLVTDLIYDASDIDG